MSIPCHESGETNIELSVFLSSKGAQIIEGRFVCFCSDIQLLVNIR